MRTAYWADPDYIKAVLGKIAACTDFVQSPAGFPIAVFDNDAAPAHLACPPGFLSPDSLGDFEAYLQTAIQAGKDRQAATAFLQFRGKEQIEKCLQSHLSHFSFEQRRAVYIPLDSEEAMLEKLTHKMRWKIRSLKNKGVAHKNEYHPEFQTLYDRLADQHDFSATYRYSHSDLQAMLDCDAIKPVSVFGGERKYLGGSLIGHYSDEICDYIISTNNKDIKISGRSVLWESLCAAKDMGYKFINLGGGGAEEDDGLIYFKKSFGGVNKPFTSIRMILDLPAYERAYGPPPKDMVFEGRFPPSPL